MTRVDAPTREGAARVVSVHSGGAGFCVRACDGFYFPLGAKAQDGKSDAEMCSFVCPGTQMDVYRSRGEDMSLAVGATGRLYKDLPSAFAYRKASIPACGCQKPGSYAEWAKRLLADPTLKSGDIVVNEQSAALFTGSVRRDGPVMTSQLRDIQGSAETRKNERRDADRLLGFSFRREIAKNSGFEYASPREPNSIVVVASRSAAVALAASAAPAAFSSSAVAKSAATAVAATPVVAAAPARVVLSSPFVR
ncbi:hypothetical protein GCM10007036_06500 [Alsobacter metallidurans]|uniref:DUF2865 domain-containing protein n=1 Tax=Alsobacter metallidurans TaxID=340221 RepID=A0A917MGB7_9HYPH|nr:DUF2865 domain-containing protein [Alsobacter metallidurans]GGH10110.1 hypothetical protein GCM10007036_06500 [Alsobacter metallidurans]